MNKFILLFVLVISSSCNTEKKQTNQAVIIAKAEIFKTKTTIITNNVVTITDELYTLQFKIEKSTNNQHHLIVDMKLHKGSSFISPFEEKEFLGKFYMDLGEYTNLTFDGNLVETPKAVSRYDGFENAQVIWVAENTTYKQMLNIKTDKKFKVFGSVKFTIEPRCTLETIPFGISYKDAKFHFFDPKC